MFGKKSYLKTLELRKQEILAQSDVNRVELLKDWEVLKTEMDRIKKHVRTAGSIASSAAFVAAAAALFRHKHEAPNTESRSKVPWVSAALSGARVGASLFTKFRSFMRERR
ncbi:MAG TPA: hypothetical protein VMF08_15065 [Candidatus Sulfotelmatobacter sp.]|nr:hypothetical protein [Candidatus Sulfotelmatobacter sp.]